ncbi:hypothetical protein BJY52DRAFT_466906 [Lactarius psammicola]|nr:hypothetical protein BJY52DRAFT_466906 [Lactarius psammicola]
MDPIRWPSKLSQYVSILLSNLQLALTAFPRPSHHPNPPARSPGRDLVHANIRVLSELAPTPGRVDCLLALTEYRVTQTSGHGTPTTGRSAWFMRGSSTRESGRSRFRVVWQPTVCYDTALSRSFTCVSVVDVEGVIKLCRNASRP